MNSAYIILLGLMFSFPIFGDAENIQVYFLSRPSAKASLFNLEQAPHFSFSPLAQANLKEEDFKCEPFGEGCFHPQLGYIEDQEKVMKAKGRQLEDVELKTINAEEVNLIDCDQGYYFDMYCGQANKGSATKSKPSHFELWVDVSSSMRQVDFSTDQAYCERRRIIAKLKDSCKGKVDVYSFNTSRKSLGALENACLNHGTNDGGQIVKWLKQTDAKNVVIITDVDEYHGEFREYLDANGAKITGIGVEPFLAENLYSSLEKFTSLCSSK